MRWTRKENSADAADLPHGNQRLFTAFAVHNFDGLMQSRTSIPLQNRLRMHRPILPVPAVVNP